MAANQHPKYRQGTSAERAVTPAPQLPTGTLWYETNTGNFYEVVFNGTTHVYAPYPTGGGGGEKFGLLYVVDNNSALSPFAIPGAGVRGPFQTIADALAQIAIDGATPATIMIVRGTYVENVTLPVNVSMVGMTQSGLTSSGTNYAVIVVGTITIEAAAAGGPAIQNVLSGFSILSNSAPTLVCSGTLERHLTISNMGMIREDSGDVVLLTNTNTDSSLTWINSRSISSVPATSTAIVGTTFVGNQEYRESAFIGAVRLGVTSSMNTSRIQGTVFSAGGVNLRFCSFLNLAAGDPVLSLAGGTTRVERCVVRMLGSTGAAIAATSPSTVELSSLELNGGSGQLFSTSGSAITHTAIPGQRAHVVATSALNTATVAYTTDVYVNTNTASPAITLPLLDGYPQGKLLFVKKIGATDLTLGVSGSDQIDGLTSFVVPSGYGAILIGDRVLDQWRVMSLSSGTPSGTAGATLLYVVAQAGTPMAVTGTFPDVDAAATQAVTDFGGSPLNADILVLPGTYGGFLWLPGMQVSALTDDAPEQESVLIKSTIVVSQTFDASTDTGSIKGLCVRVTGVNGIEGDVTPPSNGALMIRQCTVEAQGGDAVSLPNATMILRADRSDFTGTSAFDAPGVDVELTSGSTSGEIDVASIDAQQVLFESQILLTSAGSSSLDRCAIAFVASPYITLEARHSLAVANSWLEDGLDTSVAVGTASRGTLTLRTGSFPGARLYADGITVATTTSARSYFAQDVTMVGAGTTNILNGAEYIEASFAVGSIGHTLQLPLAATQPPNKEIIVKRGDNDGTCALTIATQGGNTIDALGSALTSILLGPNDTVRFVVRRGATTAGRYMRVP